MTREACRLTCDDALYPGCWVLEEVCSTCPHQCGYQKSWPLEHHTCRITHVSCELSLACLWCPQHAYKMLSWDCIYPPVGALHSRCQGTEEDVLQCGEESSIKSFEALWQSW